MQAQSQTSTAYNVPLAIMVAVAWWFLTRPYRGIWHDGIFYTVQALRYLHPEKYAQDVFFLYGSQDDYSIFSTLQAWLTNIAGMEDAFLLLTLAGAALWLYALVRLLNRWLLVDQLAFTVVVVMSADAHYGGFDMFGYGEGFASPRIFSEALVLLSLSLWFEGRRVIAGFALAGAAVLHLLIALAGVGVVVWAILSARVARPVVLWLALLVAGLLGMQFAVWTGLSPQLDSLWAKLVVQRSPFIFPHLWELGDWLRLVLDALLLWLASRYLHEEAGKLAGWALVVFFLGVLFSLAAGLMGVQLAVAGQLHRAHWLAHLLAISLVVPLVLQLWNTNKFHDRLLAVGIGSSLIFPFNTGGLVLPAVYGMYRWACLRMPDFAPGRGLAALLLVSLPTCGLALWLVQAMAEFVMVPHVEDRPAWLLIVIQPPVALGVFAFIYFLSSRWRQARLASWIYAVGILLVGLAYWGASKPWKHYEEPDRIAAIAEVRSLIPKDALVYWESGQFVSPENRVSLDRGFEQTWFWLGRSHYASIDQAAGMIFYRRTALEIDRRIVHLRQWGFRDSTLNREENAELPKKIPLSESRLAGLCSDPVLDFVIADSPLPSARLYFEDPLTGRKFSVYDCKSFRPVTNG